MLERRPDEQCNSSYPLAGGKSILLPQQEAQSDGLGPAIEVGQDRGNLLMLTLAIDHVMERAGLSISIRASQDGSSWGLKPLLTLPEKSYCGAYSALLNLAKNPDVRYLRVGWKMRSWGKSGRLPIFGFSVFTEPSGSRVSTTVA